MRPHPTTGLPNLDETLCGLRPGDNLVWMVDSVEDYAALVEPFWKASVASERALVYFRFGHHTPLIPDDPRVTLVQLQPEAGFEQFVTRIHEVIAETGPGADYVFDLVSDLVEHWYSERMVGNFFLLSCPYLHALSTIAYFGILGSYHSFYALQPISDTTQLLLSVRRYEGRLFIHPIKVHGRYSPTMHLVHQQEGDDFVPLTDSTTTSEVATLGEWPGLKSASYRMVGVWDRLFMQGEDVLAAYRAGKAPLSETQSSMERLLRRLISRDERVLELARRHFTLEDLLGFWKRVIGSGMIGGKSVGMLLARSILNQRHPRWQKLLEKHDSFFIGSDVFYMFLVQNGCWWIRQKQKRQETLLDGVGEARRLILTGTFPDYLNSRFADMLDYFGQSPIIVRSSSLLEDNFGNAFAGKYESVFCTNQGTRDQRLAEFLRAVRMVYASAMGENAVRYRAQRGLLDDDEQMALLVQRVSGARYGRLFYPQLAGVGFSANPYVWHRDIDPQAGVLRVVFGLGTRAVDRADDDYTRVIALNAPFKRPGSSPDDLRRYSQRRVDYLDLEHEDLRSGNFNDVVRESPGLRAECFADRSEGSSPGETFWTVGFDELLRRSPLVADMSEILSTLREAYGCQVDTEFTVNLRPDGTYRINLLQCRPLQMSFPTVSLAATVSAPPQGDLLLRAHGAVLGCSRALTVERLVYVVPGTYSQLPTQRRYAVARLIGELNRPKPPTAPPVTMLIGPGRWGTKMPELGVPVSFIDISTVSVLCEVDVMHDGLTPDLSLATHFFHELVEMDMLYLGYLRARPENVLDTAFLTRSPNLLPALLPSRADLSDVVRVLEAPANRQFVVTADHMQQTATLFLTDR